MRTRNSLLITVCLCNCSLLPAVALSQDIDTPSAKQVIELYIDALGGERKLKEVGGISARVQAEPIFGAPRSYHIRWKDGKYLVEEAQVRGSSGQSFINQFGFDGVRAWTKPSDAKPESHQHDMARMLHSLERFGVTPYALLLRSFPGEVTQNGKQLVDSRPTWHLTFEWPNGQKDQRYFDIESGLLSRVEIGMAPGTNGGFGGGSPTIEFTWRDRPVKGMTALQDSRVVSNDLRTKIESISFGEEFDELLFEIPDASPNKRTDE